MKRNLTAQDILAHIEGLIAARLPTQSLAHDEFNKGVKFVTDYVSEFINVDVRPTKWKAFWIKLKRIIWNDEV